MTTVTMQSPSAAYNTVVGASGTTYYSNSAGLVSNVAAADIASLQAAGFSIVSPGYGSLHVNLNSGKNIDGSALAAAASSGKFGLTVSLGTASNLVSQAANNGTITDSVMWEVVLPDSFPSGSSPDLIVNGNHVIGSGTLGAHTLALHAYPVADNGTHTADIVTTAAQNTPAAAADLTYHTDTTVLLAGGRVIVEAVLTMVETATQNVTFKLNSIRFGPDPSP